MDNKKWLALEDKVRFLLNASSYPEPTQSIQSIETHMSWIFLTEHHAYKLRKPVQLKFVNFSHLNARHKSTSTELQLNRQLASDIYLGLIPLIQHSDGQLHLGRESGHKGKVIDWLLKMKRLPQPLLLDHAISHNNIPRIRLLQAAKKLTTFYQTNPPLVLAPEAYQRRLTIRLRDNYQALLSPVYGLDEMTLRVVYQVQMTQLQECKKLLFKRVTQGRIVEGHGDLRPEHICLTAPPAFIDRPELELLERAADPVEELSLLHIECELLGHPEVGELFSSHYQHISGDNYPPVLSAFYKSVCALNRAKFSVWHLDDPMVKDKDRFRRKAEGYIAIASLIAERDGNSPAITR